MDNYENNKNFSPTPPKRRRDQNKLDSLADPNSASPTINDGPSKFQGSSNQPPKKRFYQKWWFWLLVVLIVAAICVLGFFFLHQAPAAEKSATQESKVSSASSKTKMQKKSRKTQKSAAKVQPNGAANPSQPNSQVASGNKATSNAAIGKTGSALEVFNAIKVGDTAQNGTGGNSESELKKLLGDPQKTEELTYEGKNAKKETWGSVIGITQGSGTMVILIQSGAEYLAVSKTSVGISSDQKKAAFDLAQYNQLQLAGLTPETVVQNLGQPNAMTTSLLNGKNFTSYTWTSNLKGEKDAYLTISFTDNVATGKDQQGLK